jgi:hypothetical protein
MDGFVQWHEPSCPKAKHVSYRRGDESDESAAADQNARPAVAMIASVFGEGVSM